MSAVRITPEFRPALVLAASIVVVAAIDAGTEAAHAAATASFAAQHVEGVAYARLGPDALGCAVQKDETSPVVLKVTAKAALPAARRIAAGMRFPVTVRLIPRRYGLPGMAPLYRALNKAAEGRSPIAITRDMEATRPDTCGAARIWFGVENAAWAIRQQNRFGGDRVTLKLVEPGGRIPV